MSEAKEDDIEPLNDLGLYNLANSYLEAIKRMKEMLEEHKKAEAAYKSAAQNIEDIKLKLMLQAKARGGAINIVVLDGNGVVRAEPPDRGYSLDTTVRRVYVEQVSNLFAEKKKK